MKKLIYLLPFLIAAVVVSCNKHEVADPVIYTFEATPTTFARTDTVTFTVDAEPCYSIILFDGKNSVDLTDAEFPYTHQVSRIKTIISAPADTVWAKLILTNLYDTDNIKHLTDSIQLIITP